MSKRRTNVPFDPYYFEKQSREGQTYSIGETFRHVYRSNLWCGAESVSGEGASPDHTTQIQLMLPALLQELAVETLLDVPCGDFGWMRLLDLPVSRYIGGDIVPEIVARNQQQYGTARRQFIGLDLTQDQLPSADLLLCRDCFVHLSFADIQRAMSNITRTQVRYLLTTTFPDCEENEDITTGDWRLLNLERPPFNLPPPLRLIDERCSEGNGQYRDKSLALWPIDALALPCAVNAAGGVQDGTTSAALDLASLEDGDAAPTVDPARAAGDTHRRAAARGQRLGLRAHIPPVSRQPRRR